MACFDPDTKRLLAWGKVIEAEATDDGFVYTLQRCETT